MSRDLNVPAAVYRHINAAGETLYIGCSAVPGQRFINHLCVSRWAREVSRIDIAWFATRAEALAEEARLIRTERPPMNQEWKPKQRRWKTSSGPEVFQLWLDSFNLTTERVANHLAIKKPRIDALLGNTATPRCSMTAMICITSGGMIPMRAWDRHQPIPVRLLAKGDAKNALAHAVSCMRVWGTPKPSVLTPESAA